MCWLTFFTRSISRYSKKREYDMREDATPAASSALAAATGTRAATEAKALRGRMGKAAARVSQPHGSHTSHMMINQNGTEQREQVMESLSLAQEVPPVLDLPLLWLRLLRPHTTNGGFMFSLHLNRKFHNFRRRNKRGPHRSLCADDAVGGPPDAQNCDMDKAEM